jgi:hypothetical protein
MAGSRGKVINDDAKRWGGGQLPTAEYYAKVFSEERERAAEQVERALVVRRSRRHSSAAAQRSKG